MRLVGRVNGKMGVDDVHRSVEGVDETDMRGAAFVWDALREPSPGIAIPGLGAVRAPDVLRVAHGVRRMRL